MSFKLSRRSLSNLKNVHPDLVKTVQRAIEITPVDFVVTEGLRSVNRQKELYAAGATWTMNSRHLTGHAVDLAAWVGEVRWDWSLYDRIAFAMKQAAEELDIDLVWGGDWKKRDGCHFELNRRTYP